MTQQHATPAEQLTHARQMMRHMAVIAQKADYEVQRSAALNSVAYWQRRIDAIMDDLQTEVSA